MFVFFDVENTQDLERENGCFEHVPNLVCCHQTCPKCESVADISVDCVQCGKREHVFWGPDVIGKFVDYLRIDRPFLDKIFVIAHNSRGYDNQFLLRRFLELKWTPKLIMDGTKILSMSVEHLEFRDSLNFVPMGLRAMSKAFDLRCRKGYYPHFFNTDQNLNYVGPVPEPRYYGVDFMSGEERVQFLE
jgi:hypothetical protein